MTRLANTFEGGTDGVTLTAGSGGNTGGASGDYFQQVDKPSDGINRFTASSFAVGAMSCEMATRTVTGALDLIYTAAQRGSIADDYIRFYYYTDDKTTGGLAKNIVRWFGSGSSLGGLLMGNNRLYATDNTNAAVSGNSTTLLPAAAWVRIEAWLHPRTDGTGSIQVKLFLDPAGTVADWDFTISGLTYTQAFTDQIVFGNAGPGANWPSAAGFMRFDDIVTGESTWVGPATSGRSRPYVDISVAA